MWPSVPAKKAYNLSHGSDLWTFLQRDTTFSGPLRAWGRSSITGMEEAVCQELLQVALHGAPCELLAVHTHPLQLLDAVDLHAGRILHCKYLPRRVLPQHLRHLRAHAPMDEWCSEAVPTLHALDTCANQKYDLLGGKVPDGFTSWARHSLGEKGSS